MHFVLIEYRVLSIGAGELDDLVQEKFGSGL